MLIILKNNIQWEQLNPRIRKFTQKNFIYAYKMASTCIVFEFLTISYFKY